MEDCFIFVDNGFFKGIFIRKRSESKFKLVLGFGGRA